MTSVVEFVPDVNHCCSVHLGCSILAVPDEPVVAGDAVAAVVVADVAERVH